MSRAAAIPIHVSGCLSAGTDQTFRLNWAANGRQGNAGPTDFSLFVGDLAEEVTDYMLQEAFRRLYPSVRSAKVSLPSLAANATPGRPCQGSVQYSMGGAERAGARRSCGPLCQAGRAILASADSLMTRSEIVLWWR